MPLWSSSRVHRSDLGIAPQLLRDLHSRRGASFQGRRVLGQLNLPILPIPGLIAKLRQRLYLIKQVVRPPKAADPTLVKLSCVDDDAQGQPLEVLWDKELAPELLSGEAWEANAKRGHIPPCWHVSRTDR